MTGKVVEVLKAIIHGQCQEMSIQKLALEIMPDHLHLFVGAKPTVTHFKIIHKLKGNTSIQLRRCFPELRYLGYKQHFGSGFDNLWAIGYYCGSAGHVSQEQVKRYAQKCKAFLALKNLRFLLNLRVFCLRFYKIKTAFSFLILAFLLALA